MDLRNVCNKKTDKNGSPFLRRVFFFISVYPRQLTNRIYKEIS